MVVSIQAGNSDNGLTQQKWSEFVAYLDSVVKNYQTVRHFFGGSITWAEWQNVCWVVEIDEEYFLSLKNELRRGRAVYQQDSVCVFAGVAEFV